MWLRTVNAVPSPFSARLFFFGTECSRSTRGGSREGDVCRATLSDYVIHYTKNAKRWFRGPDNKLIVARLSRMTLLHSCCRYHYCKFRTLTHWYQKSGRWKKHDFFFGNFRKSVRHWHESVPHALVPGDLIHGTCEWEFINPFCQSPTFFVRMFLCASEHLTPRTKHFICNFITQTSSNSSYFSGFPPSHIYHLWSRVNHVKKYSNTWPLLRFIGHAPPLKDVVPAGYGGFPPVTPCSLDFPPNWNLEIYLWNLMFILKVHR